METDIEDIANSVRDLSIVGDTPQDHGQEPLRSTHNHRASLQDAIQMLVQPTKTINSQAQYIKSLTDDANFSINLSIPEVFSLHGVIRKLANLAMNLESTVDALTEWEESFVIIHLKSLGSQSAAIMFKGQPPIQELFSHFDKEIRNIVRQVLNNSSDQNRLWRVAEECYKQAASPSGILQADDYFIPLEEACLQSPYDPDFESEEYYEHENRLDEDEDYATYFQARKERRDQGRRKDRQNWIDFWIRVLSNSPAGPTLFYPPASFSSQSLNFDDVPQYLFRTFDEASSGRNDESVIASMTSILRPQEISRIDLLALERHKAAELLHMHLTKECFGGKNGSDNLMSWTSSLLFAIQYAVWRRRSRGCRPSDIKICAVDTKKFPQGQFARDTWLFKACKSTAGQDDPAQKFFDFRLTDKRFYNGEYLSQGAVNHANRSSVVSLEHLIQDGLFQLYPEFDDHEGSMRWAYRVLQLRQNWSAEEGTADWEIELALRVARNCFSQFAPLDIASILLTFKNRRYSRPTPISKWPVSFSQLTSNLLSAPNLLKILSIISANSRQNGQTSQTKSVDTGLLPKQPTPATKFPTQGTVIFFNKIRKCYERFLTKGLIIREELEFTWLRDLDLTIIEHLLQHCQHSTNMVIVYFYFDFVDTRNQDPDLMVCSVLCQLLQHAATVPKSLDTLIACSGNKYRKSSLHALLEATPQIIKILAHVYLILDTLDECTQLPELMDMFQTVADWEVGNLHLLIASRKERDIESALGSFVRQEDTVCLQSDIVDNDIHRYVQNRLSTDKCLAKWVRDAAIKQDIETAIMRGARGMYSSNVK